MQPFLKMYWHTLQYWHTLSFCVGCSPEFSPSHSNDYIIEDNGVVNHKIVAIHTTICPVAHTFTNGRVLQAAMKCKKAFPENKHRPPEC